MKKALFALAWLLFFSGSAHAQATFPRFTGVYYRITENTLAYRSLADTLATETSAKPLNFAPNGKLLVTAFPTAFWAEGYRGGAPYYVRVKSLAPLEKPSPGSTQATIKPIEPRTESSSGSSSHDIRTGPRGGKYYINSNGNKTYIKRK